MSLDAAEQVHRQFLDALEKGTARRRSNLGLKDVGLSPERAAALFRSQALSRQLDRMSRKLQARGEGFYTIGSSGHEGNAVLAEVLRTDDMAFLHYRDAAFQIHRAHRVPGENPAWDMLLSFTASMEDPISGGRHKVLGSKRLFIPPQTSTIASHLPKAVGTAFSIGIARRMGWSDTVLAKDGVVLCSFGDASANHSTALGAINTACWAAFQGTPMPIIFLCEDNGIGISTRTPPGWIEANFSGRAGLNYIACDGSDLVDTMRAAREAEVIARRQRKPVFLHMKTVRLYGHAGNDVQLAYRSKEEVRAEEERDPLLASAALLIEEGVMTAGEVRAVYDEIEATLERQVELAIRRPKLPDAAAVMASIVPPKREGVERPLASAQDRAALFSDDAAAMDKPQHMAKLISWAMADLLLQYPNAIVCGEDVGPKGGVYAATQKLHSRFGSARVINTLLDEQAILGLAIGAAHNGLLPMPEIQFLAYVHNAEDQIRGEAATLSFFSDGQYTNPMVVRIAGLPYQKGFGGHFHNDNSLAVFRDIPGVVLAVPSNGRDAVAMLRECVRLAHEESRVVVFVEPIALYMTRDLHEAGDGLWSSVYQPPGEGEIAFGQIGVAGEGADLAVVTYGNGFYLSLQAQKLLAERGIHVRVIDLRWLGPVNDDAVIEAVASCSRVLVVDECRITGGQNEALMALLAERAPEKAIARMAATDSFIPLARAATHTLPSRDGIVAKVLEMVRG
ncbi:dehydrogenase E1 component subunit alpha/beta [Novosphingobium taihuense]|uniref:2-oxoglutarate dehydrogenase E1 component n=1 Tax=Novosphingobium taihuense TaxID=260085 RepID=A0A7W7AAA8_9SPHN|nr:alpha-ketoacid dehydrogenase subunit alpha/beta [Novosphingobium taihuense]MBB4613345.1 2-oxoisovalerate dehydrogenase E1 component [Novosphingobium taihuense]TWH85485.1 branched-chain alpha-keto acid dehydrogenase E1 component [Novosphingobium taihuense]